MAGVEEGAPKMAGVEEGAPKEKDEEEPILTAESKIRSNHMSKKLIIPHA
jgi:hypothetical protein